MESILFPVVESFAQRPSEPLGSRAFLRTLGALAGAEVQPRTAIEVLTNGETYFGRDRAESRAVSYRDWQRRPLLERGYQWLGWLLERQQ